MPPSARAFFLGAAGAGLYRPGAGDPEEKERAVFDYDLAHWSTFVVIALAFNLSPGPDMAFIVGHTVRNGARGGLSAMLGVWTGALAHVMFAALGLSAILASSAVAFSAVKWAGAAYLVFLGIQALRSGDAVEPEDEGTPPPADLTGIYRAGVLIDLFNPKVALFFMAFLPQFVVEGAGPVWAQTALHGALTIAVAGVVEPGLVFLGGRMTASLRRNPRVTRWLNRGLGGLLVSLGVRLAILER